MVLRKDELEASLHEEKRLIETGKLKDDNPLDSSEPFKRLCDACRRGDLRVCQEAINDGANINARDQYDYTALILASLCGHYEVAELLLESGALCERDTFQGERCLYNALNDRIRNLLLSYDFSKSTDPLQPLASHITSLLSRESPQTSDIIVTSSDRSFALHKFVLAARSPYFRKKLRSETSSFKLPVNIPSQSFEVAIKYVYLSELPNDVGGGPGTGFSEEDVLEGLDKISRQLEIPSLWDSILEKNNKRLARQYRTQETDRARTQFEAWFQESVVQHRIEVDSSKADDIKWDRENSIYADVLLRADDEHEDEGTHPSGQQHVMSSIPVGPLHAADQAPNVRRSTLFPVHRAMLLRSEYFEAMFSSSFLEAQETPHLKIVPIECSPEVLEAVLRYLYTEKTDFHLDIAIEVLFAADLLLIERLKTKAALVISSLGNGDVSAAAAETVEGESENGDISSSDPLDPFQILKAAWLLRVPRLEEFAARYLAYRLEKYIDLPDFVEAVRESAARIKDRQETDTIELIDDIRHYLSERFRLRFEGEGIEEMLGETDMAKDASGPSQDGQSSIDNQESRVAAEFDSLAGVQIRTLDGELAGDEFASDAINYQLLLGKIDNLLDTLDLDG